MVAIEPVDFCMLKKDYNDLGQFLISTPKEKLICLSGMRVLLDNPFLDNPQYRKEVLKRIETVTRNFKTHTTLRKGMLLVCVREEDGTESCEELPNEGPSVIK